MDKIQSSHFVLGMDKLPRGGYLSPETFLIKVKLPNGKSVLGIASNEENIGDFGQPGVGDQVTAWVDDGMGGAKQIDGVVTDVVGEFEKGALTCYSEVFHGLLDDKHKISIPFKDFLGLLKKQASPDATISAREAYYSAHTLREMDRINSVQPVRTTLVSPAPQGLHSDETDSPQANDPIAVRDVAEKFEANYFLKENAQYQTNKNAAADAWPDEPIDDTGGDYGDTGSYADEDQIEDTAGPADTGGLDLSNAEKHGIVIPEGSDLYKMINSCTNPKQPTFVILDSVDSSEINKSPDNL